MRSIVPTPKKDCICFSKSISLTDNGMAKHKEIVHPNLESLFLEIEGEKVPSASPVINQGFNKLAQ